MHGKRKALEDDANLLVLGHESIERRLGVFTVRTLQVAELDHGHGCGCRAMRRAGYASFQHLLRIRKRMSAERHNISGDGVLAVGRNVQLQGLLTLIAAD